MDTVRSLLCGVLQILLIQAVLGKGCLRFRDKCCTLCEPGYFLANKCGFCVPCPITGYSDIPNDKPLCKHCERCEGVLFQYKANCTSTRNAVCTCTAGRKCTDEKCTQCISDRCPAGQQLVGQKCVNCPVGTFNSGAENKCTPWKNCSAVGVVIINGSHTSDVVCGVYPTKATWSKGSSAAVAAITKELKPVAKPEESDLPVVYIVVSAAVGVLLVAISIACRQKLIEKIKHICLKFPKPIVKQREEDGCSCHFPEEENGGENEPMTLEA
ncbi:tumor necrosis factor receptor superfamily member 9 [Eleutherodactylus coqui]|uniref:tumor necrosis factor receptor superfamily member 9 n=1 Tax=Eleutherodactylus coqui TaxID=57060 RepID=UPI0034633736